MCTYIYFCICISLKINITDNTLKEKMAKNLKTRSPNYIYFPSKSKESEGEVTQSCPTLCDPADCSLPGSSAHGILQARTLEWVAISFSKGSSQPRDWTRVSHIGGRHFNLLATREGGEIEGRRKRGQAEEDEMVMSGKYIISSV